MLTAKYPGHLLTQVEVNYREHNVSRLLKACASLFRVADQNGRYAMEAGSDASLSDMLIGALSGMDMSPTEQRALLHVLSEARDCVFELAARKEAFGC